MVWGSVQFIHSLWSCDAELERPLTSLAVLFILLNINTGYIGVPYLLIWGILIVCLMNSQHSEIMVEHKVPLVGLVEEYTLVLWVLNQVPFHHGTSVKQWQREVFSIQRHYLIFTNGVRQWSPVHILIRVEQGSIEIILALKTVLAVVISGALLFWVMR